MTREKVLIVKKVLCETPSPLWLKVFGIFCLITSSPLLGMGQQAAPPVSANQSASSSNKSDGASATPKTPPQSDSAAAPAKSSTNSTPSVPAKRRRKKKVAANDCNTPGASNASSNCPPSKVIVRQGGASDPSIALAGGTAGTQASQRDTANQMLASTEENLKKIAGRQLSSDEQNMVNQIRQFMEQSKVAVGDSDLDRARTLAWKAQVLSEELVKPAN